MVDDEAREAEVFLGKAAFGKDGEKGKGEMRGEEMVEGRLREVVDEFDSKVVLH